MTYAELTDEGAARLRAASCAHVGAIRAVLGEHLSDQQIEELAELLGATDGDDCAAAPARFG